jgi:hypothetical protein
MIRKVIRLWAWSFVVAGLAMGYFSFGAIGDTLGAWLFDESAEGEVVGHETSTVGIHQQRTLVAPVIRFTTDDGQAVTFTDVVQDRGSSDYHIGEKVGVRYDPDYPEAAAIATSTLWTGGAGMLGVVFAIILTLTGLLILLLAKLPWQAAKD